jgi:glucose/mannose transport system substrate-binding protein
MGPEFNRIFSQINGSLPPRTDISLDGPDFQDCQRDAAANLKAAVASNRVVVSLAQNMAQTAPVTAALRDVIAEFVHDNRVTPEQAQKRLVEAAASVR